MPLEVICGCRVCKSGTDDDSNDKTRTVSEWELLQTEKDKDEIRKRLIFFHFCAGGPMASTFTSHSGGGGSSTPGSGMGVKQSGIKGMKDGEGGQVDDTWYSIFPVETPELVYGRWEDEVIWSIQELVDVPEPKVLSLDPNDENIVLCIPGEKQNLIFAKIIC